MAEFVIAGQNYRTVKMDAWHQFHLSRKVSPFIPTLAPIFVALADSQKDNPLSADLAGMAQLFEPFAEAIAGMSVEDAEYVMGTCLAVTSRQQGSTWAPVCSGQQRAIMFDDVDAGVMLQIAVTVIRESLGPFFAGLLSISAPQNQAQA